MSMHSEGILRFAWNHLCSLIIKFQEQNESPIVLKRVKESPKPWCLGRKHGETREPGKSRSPQRCQASSLELHAQSSAYVQFQHHSPEQHSTAHGQHDNFINCPQLLGPDPIDACVRLNPF